MKTVDLHTHSNYSDGTCSTEELVTLAAEKGLAAIALTDHDTTAGVESALAYAKEQQVPLQVIPGTELSVMYKKTEIHMVGLFIDYRNESLINACLEFVARRGSRNEEMIANFNQAGIPMTLEALKEGNPDTVVTRAHFARYLIGHGFAKDSKEAFAKYLDESCPYYVPRYKITYDEGIRLILGAGGVPILAHPLHYHLPENTLRELIAACKENGLAGIEVKYVNHTKQDEYFVNRLAKQYELLPSGGSDFHGSNKPDIALGTGRGNLSVPWEYLEQLAAFAGKKML